MARFCPASMRPSSAMRDTSAMGWRRKTSLPALRRCPPRRADAGSSRAVRLVALLVVDLEEAVIVGEQVVGGVDQGVELLGGDGHRHDLATLVGQLQQEVLATRRDVEFGEAGHGVLHAGSTLERCYRSAQIPRGGHSSQ